MSSDRAPRSVVLSRASLAVPALVLAGATAIALAVVPRAAAGRERELLASAVTLDLLVVWPLAVAWFWVRTRRVPWFALASAVLLGFLAASLALPADSRALLERAHWLAVPLELALVGTLVVLVRRGRREARTLPGDFATRLRAAATHALGARLPADVLTSEVALLVHAFAPRRREGPARAEHFSTHREAGYGAVLVGVVMLVLVETAAVHALVSAWSQALSWVLTGLGAYSLLWLVGDWRALRARPIVVGPEALELRLGLRWEARIPRACIEHVARLPRRRRPRPDGVRVVALLGQPNVELRFADPVELVGVYGLRRSTRRLWLRVDEAERFVAALACASPSSNA